MSSILSVLFFVSGIIIINTQNSRGFFNGAQGLDAILRGVLLILLSGLFWFVFRNDKKYSSTLVLLIGMCSFLFIDLIPSFFSFYPK